jgi:sacsin
MNYRTGRRKPGVKIKLSKLKSHCLDQLTPFEGLWGYSRELEYYGGTIFRFPLRPATLHSKLRESKTVLDYDATEGYMEQFLSEARISLLFLRNVRSLDFKVSGDSHTRWSVISSRGEMNDFSDWTVCTVTKGDGSEPGITIEDRWWTAVQDTLEFPIELLHRHKGTMKDVECGIAALVSSSKHTKLAGTPKARIFSSLPLPLKWDLPVHIHATFITFGDRNSIMIENSAREDGADWNTWLLTSAIPNLYLPFLEDLTRKVGKDAFRFWPQAVPPKGSLSELVYISFWEQLRSSSCRLFPLARQPDTKKRQPPKLLELKQATFDFLPRARWSVLRSFLESEIPTLVRVPSAIAKMLQSSPPIVTYVTPSVLRMMFHSEEAAKQLAKIEPKLEAFDVLLKEIIPKCDADFEELNGCRVLPLADGTMGMLRIQKPMQPNITYYIASKREVGLFNFALEILTPEDQGSDLKAALLNYEKKFNFKRLDLSGVGTLLGKKSFQAITPTPEFDTWLQQFWIFWHEREVDSAESVETIFNSAPGVNSCPILEATCDGVKTYLRPSDLGSFPSVVEPADEEQKKMCDKISGLYRINKHYIPLYLMGAEASLSNAPSFSRLIKSLLVLATQHGVGLEKYIRNIFGEVELKVHFLQSFHP